MSRCGGSIKRFGLKKLSVCVQRVAPVLQDDDEIEAVEIPRVAEEAPVIVCFSACENFQKPSHQIELLEKSANDAS
eukprot:4306167-Amphidinium_carterae.1